MNGKKNVAIISCTHETLSFSRSRQLAQHLNNHLLDTYTFSIVSRNYYGWLSFFFSFGKLIKTIWQNRLIMFIGSPCILALILAKLAPGRKIIVHPENLRWNWLGRSFLRQLSIRIRERLIIRCADLIIVDDRNLQKYLSEQYNIQSILIHHGTMEGHIPVVSDHKFGEFPFLKEKFALFFSEISPVSQAKLVLKAFAQYPKYHLVVVGNWAQGKNSQTLKTHFESYEHIHFLEPRMDPSFLNMLLNKAHIYLHSYEGWGANLSLKNALSRQLPAFAFDLNSLHESQPEGVKFYRHASHLIDQLIRLPRDKSISMKTHPDPISWQQIASQFDTAFQACLTGKEKQEISPLLTTLHESPLPLGSSSHIGKKSIGE